MSRSILYVLTPGGPPLEYALTRVCQHGDVHALLCAPRSNRDVKLLHERCRSVRFAGRDDPMPDAIVAVARDVAADAVVTMNEWAIVAVSEACGALGLRGAGPRARLSRDKVRMRETWRDAGVPIPAFIGVRALEDLRRAARELTMPFLLKPSLAASSAGQAIIDRDTDLEAVWTAVTDVLTKMDGAGARELMPDGRGVQLIAEEIIDATTESWYEHDGFGDYLSVEGIVANGRYHPVCITSRLPTVPPFIEVTNQLPVVLSVEQQRRIEETACAAVGALRLDCCGTHTEIKLQAGGGLCLLESAARLGGVMIVREVEEVFGVDLVDQFVRVLLGEPHDLPERMLTSDHAHGAAATLSMLAVDSRGRPWSSLPAFRPDHVRWEDMTSPGTVVEIVHAMSMPMGSTMPTYTTTGGHMNYAGTLYLRARDALTLRADSVRILDGMEAALSGVERELSAAPEQSG
jgi:biotin carboxylase